MCTEAFYERQRQRAKLAATSRKTSQKQSFTLPSLAAFKRMSLKQRTILFRDWAATQPARRTYDEMDIGGCALCRFGRALCTDAKEVNAASCEFYIENEEVQVICYGNPNPIFSPGLSSFRSTFGSLVKRLDKHISLLP